MTDTGKDVVLSGPCNLLRPMEELAAGLVRVRLAVAAVGNWVGGRFELTDEALIFRANALNVAYQIDAAPVVVTLEDVHAVTEGRLMLFVRTVDLATGPGTYRLRCRSSMTPRLLVALSDRVPGRRARGPLDLPPDGC